MSFPFLSFNSDPAAFRASLVTLGSDECHSLWADETHEPDCGHTHILTVVMALIVLSSERENKAASRKKQA